MGVKVVSLFCGPGGMDLGFKMAGFDIVWGVDIDKYSCETHRNWSNAEILNTDINNIDIDDIPVSDVIVSSLLSQNFSSVSIREFNNYDLNYATLSIISKKMPKAFICEGSNGILLYDKQKRLGDFLKECETIGYNFYFKTLNYKDYGIPQNRQKLVIVGIRKDINFKFEFPVIENKNTTIEEAFKCLEHKDLNLNYRCSILAKDLERRKNKILDEHKVSPAIIWNRLPINSRVPIKEDRLFTISYQEAAIIQSFPMDFEFSGNKLFKFKQITNAFAPKLALKIANQLKRVLNGEKDLNEYILHRQNYNIQKSKDINEIKNNTDCYAGGIKMEKLMLPDRYEGLEDNRKKYDITKIILPVKEGINKIVELHEEIESSNRGAFLILKGKSGCGKTTFLRTLDVFIEDIEIYTIFNDSNLVESMNSLQDTKKD